MSTAHDYNTAATDSNARLTPPVNDTMEVQPMKALTLWQPWASLIPAGLKKYETRSWSTSYRGKLLIHAAKRNYAQDALELARLHPDIDKAIASATPLPLGAIVAIADLTGCVRMMPTEGYAAPWELRITSQTQLERVVGDWQPGRFAWKLENVQPINPPIPCKGAQQLWTPSSEIIQKVEASLNG